MESIAYFSSRSSAKKIFIFIYAVFIIVGSILSPKIIWELADLAIGAMTLINLFILVAMNKEVKRETEEYFGRK
jgi:Na+/alanine symporter